MQFYNELSVSFDGLIMGNTISLLLADIFMDNLKSKIHESSFSTSALFKVGKYNFSISS